MHDILKLSVAGIPHRLRLAHFGQMFFQSPLLQSYSVFVFLVVSIHVSGISTSVSNLCCNGRGHIWMASFTLRV